MRAPSIFVVGPEGSGTTLLWRCLVAHPELRPMRARVAPGRGRRIPATGVLMHISLPTLRPMLWVRPTDLPRGARVIALRRSPVHTVYSAYRRFHDEPGEAWRAYFHAVELEGRYVAIHRPWCVSYEALVSAPAEVLRGVFEWLGVRGDFLPPIKIRARNDQRWRADAEFAEFMRRSFGKIEGAGDAAPAQRVRSAPDTTSQTAPAAARQSGQQLSASLAPLRRRRGGGQPAADGNGRPIRTTARDGFGMARSNDRSGRPQSAGYGPPRVLAGRYVLIDDFLTPREHDTLLAYARARETDFAASGVIAGDGTSHVDAELRRSSTIGNLDDVWSMFETRLRRLLPYVRRTLELAWFPLGRIERQMTVHRDGGFFRPHTDSTDPAVAGRCITGVYYFHDHPKRFSGGELWLYDTLVRGGHSAPGDHHVRVDATDNTAVFFASDIYHEVRPVQRQSESFADSRFSINVWFWQAEPARRITAPDDRLFQPARLSEDRRGSPRQGLTPRPPTRRTLTGSRKSRRPAKRS